MQDRLARVFARQPLTDPPITALCRAYEITATVAPTDREQVLLYQRVRAETQRLRPGPNWRQAFGTDELVTMLAARMGVSPTRDDRPEIAVVAISSVASASFTRWVERGGRGDPSRKVAAALTLVRSGLAALDRPKLSRGAPP